jgi:cell division initiation protein
VTEEFDVPVFQSADQIRRREFVATRRGYDPEQVRAYLEQIADQVQTMEQMLRTARMKVEAATGPIAAPKTDPYAQVASRVAEAIRVADESAQQMIAEAKQKADALLGDAKTAADRVRAEAQATADSALLQAETTVREARVRAAEAVAALVARRESILERLDGTKERLEAAARAMQDIIDARGVEDLPSPEEVADPVLPPVVVSGDGDAVVDTTVLDPAYADLWTEDGGGAGGAAPSAAPATPATPPVPTASDDLDDLPVMPAVDLSWGDDAEDARPGS